MAREQVAVRFVVGQHAACHASERAKISLLSAVVACPLLVRSIRYPARPLVAHDDRDKTPLLSATVAAQPQAIPLVLQARVLRVTFENNETGYRVLRVEVPGLGVETVVGVLPPVGPDVELHIVGRRVNDPKHGPQIAADHATVVTPTTRDGITRFLGSGIVRGVGPKTAERIVAHLGDETLRELDEGGARLAEIKGIGPSMAKAIAEAWKVQRGTSDAMVFLRGHDIPSGLANRIFRKYGPDTVRVVQGNPYRLAHEVNGVGFIKADRIAESLGVARDAPDRVDAGVVHSLYTINEEGHTFAMRWELAARAAEQLGVPADLVEQSIDRGVLAGHLVLEEEPSGIRVFPRHLYAAEVDVALSLKRLLTTPSPVLSAAGEFLEVWERTSHLKLAPAQRTAVLTAASSKVLVLTGGPGVGKTTVVRAVLEMFRHAQLKVRLAAPTGRAAKRMSEATHFEASTIHRLLEVDPRSGKFQRDASNPIECHALIVDESSMIDIVLARALLTALPPGARLILVGDSDQLPSVGPGAVLLDLISSGALAVVKLETIFRQGAGSLIVDNAHRIRAGEMPTTSSSPDGDFFLIEQREADLARSTLREVVQNRIPRRFGLDPRRDIQVLSPMNKSATGVRAINEDLQSALNPSGPALMRIGIPYRVGDKVMQLRNDYERDVYNGDVGAIESVDPDRRTLRVRIDDRLVEYDDQSLEDLSLAYAISIHKSQGSEYPAVVIPWQKHHFVMLSRKLLYTAVTRGKRLVVLVADPYALKLGLADERKGIRRTGLAGRL